MYRKIFMTTAAIAAAIGIAAPSSAEPVTTQIMMPTSSIARIADMDRKLDRFNHRRDLREQSRLYAAARIGASPTTRRMNPPR